MNPSRNSENRRPDILKIILLQREFLNIAYETYLNINSFIFVCVCMYVCVWMCNH
jgi:hypothetical protein